MNIKKISALLLILTLFLFLIACSKKETTVVISKIITTSTQENNVIELYNNSDHDVSLSKYHINIYTNGSSTVNFTFALTGTIKANNYYVISGNHVTHETVSNLSDYTYTEGSLPYNGNDVIELTSKGSTVDFVGTIGLDNFFSRNVTLIRLGEKSSFKPSKVYDRFNFISYLPEQFNYLKNDSYEIKTIEQLLKGPSLDDRYLSLEYVDSRDESETGTGGGGATPVKLRSIADGDTASFGETDVFEGGSMRYYYIDTPEVDGTHVSAAPWGYVASKFNKEYLLNDESNKIIHVQSIPGGALRETYGRSIGLVWVNGHLSQFLIVREGLSDDVPTNFQDQDIKLYYKNIPYLTFLQFAEYQAKTNGWGMKGYPLNLNGEKSPDWNYETNRYTTKDPYWQPHYTLPWA